MRATTKDTNVPLVIERMPELVPDYVPLIATGQRHGVARVIVAIAWPNETDGIAPEGKANGRIHLMKCERADSPDSKCLASDGIRLESGLRLRAARHAKENGIGVATIRHTKAIALIEINHKAKIFALGAAWNFSHTRSICFQSRAARSSGHAKGKTFHRECAYSLSDHKAHRCFASTIRRRGDPVG